MNDWSHEKLRHEYETLRLQLEEAVRSKGERLQLALDAAHLATWDWHIPSGKISWNSEHYRMLGYEPDSFTPAYRHWADRVHPEDLPGVESRIQQAIKDGGDYHAEFRAVLPDGSVRVLEALGRIEWDQAGGVVSLYGAMSDITAWKTLVAELQQINETLEQRVAERTAEVRESQELFSLFMKHTPVYTFIKRIEGEQSRVIITSDNFIDMVGRPAAELRGRTMDELFPADFARKITDDDLAVIREGKDVELDEEFNGRSYTTIKFPIISEGRDKLIAGFTIDETERRKSEALLRESDERFRLAFENANVGMCLVDTQGKLFKVNRQLCEIFGYSKEEMEGMTVSDIAHPDYRDVSTAFIHQAESGEVDHSEFEKTYIHKDGRTVCGQVSSSLVRSAAGEPLYFISHVLDITARKQAEEERLNLERQLLHAQKLESLGVLAGGIAHDFNNILMAIIGNAELARMKLKPESPLVANLQQIVEASMRAAELAKQMLAYSGKGKLLVEKLELNRIIEEMLPMLEVSISKKALLRFKLNPDIPAVEADATQIHQLIINLVINASEAIGDQDGAITITTGSMTCDRNSLNNTWSNDNLSEGLYVYLEVTDSGCGMDKEVLDKLFDPFFSTKFTGRGLGMPAALGIIRGHKGTITVSSEPGKGTSCKILLPAADRSVKIVSAAAGTEEWQGHGTVLLVDDEEPVLGVGAELLKMMGFTVKTARDGVVALETYKTCADLVCVILDLTMPHMSGEECFRELRKINPEVKVIIASGYSEYEVAQKFVCMGLTGVIQKPYSFSKLKETLKKLTQ